MLIFFPYISYEKFSEKVSKQLFFGLLECLLLVFFYLFFLVYQKFLSTSSKILHKFLDRFNATSSRKPAMLLIYCRYHLYMHLLYLSLKYNTGQNNWIESKESINADQGVGKQLLLIFLHLSPKFHFQDGRYQMLYEKNSFCLRQMESVLKLCVAPKH